MSYKIPYAGAETKGRPALRIIANKPAQVSKPLDKITYKDISCSFDSTNSYVKIDSRPINIPPSPDSIRKILFEVCKDHDLHPNDVVGYSKALHLIKARREFIWRCRNETTASFPRIAKSINRDHTTVIYHYYYMKTLIRSEYSGIKFAKKLSKIGKSNSQSLLTERQIMVRTLLLQGFTIMEIAADMGVCVTTIKKEKARIDKLDPLPPISD